MPPLVSTIIPAYNAERTLAYTLASALAQTWKHHEILIIDDGSTDRTGQIAEQYASSNVKVFHTENRGPSAAINLGLRHAQGDYVQELDSDDLLAPDKVERQLAAAARLDNPRILLSSAWAPFYYRTRHARFVRHSLCEDLPPTEWLIRKMSQNIYMQNATWLVSRPLVEDAGFWDEELYYDNDGEYFARVLRHAEGTHFVSGTGVYYRATSSGSISHIGSSHRKKTALLRSMKLHIECLLSLEDSPRSRAACIAYLQNWYPIFYPEQVQIVADVDALAHSLGGHLEAPRLRWKFAWLRPLFGWEVAKRAQSTLPILKADCLRSVDRLLFLWEARAEAGYASFHQAKSF